MESHFQNTHFNVNNEWSTFEARAFRAGAWPVIFKLRSQHGFFKTRFCCYRIFRFFIRSLTFWKRKYKYYSLFLLYNFISKFDKIFVTSNLQYVTTLIAHFAVSKINGKKGVFYVETSSVFHWWELLAALEDKIRIPARPCNILFF